MATRDIKTRFKLEGEGEFKRAMSEAASAVKVLNSEEKLAKAQFEATGDAQQYAADQARILKEQIEFQSKAVKAAEDAIRALTDNGVDKNASQVKKWQLKLNNAKTALLQMQLRLDKVGTELGEEETKFGDAQSAGEEFQKGMEGVADGINLQNAITAIDTVKGHIETIVKTAAKAAKAIWDMGIEGSVWADNLSSAANEAGIDVETYQSWLYASKFIDTSVDDIVRNWRDIDSKMAAEGDALRDYLELLNSVGIASADNNGLRAGKDIFWEMIDYLHGIGDESERTRQAMTLFGNDWRKLNPLITAGSAAYKDLAEEGRTVAVVAEDQVSALGKTNDKYEDLMSRLEKLKMNSLAALAPTFNQVAEALSTAVTAMDEFVQSEEGQAALGELNEALSGLIKAFLGDDNGEGTFQDIVEGAKGAVTGLTDALDWISQNGDSVAWIVKGLGAAWATLAVSKEVLTFVALLKMLPLNKLSALFSGGKTLTAPTVAAGGGATTGKAAGTGFIANLTNMAGVAAPYLTGAAITAAFGAFMDKWSTEKNYGQYNSIIEQMQAAMGYANDKAEDLRQNILKLREAWGQGNGEGVAAGREFFAANAAQIYQMMPDLSIFERWKDVFGEITEGSFTPERMNKFIGEYYDDILFSDVTVAEHWETFIREYTEHAAILAEKAEEQGSAASEALADGLEATSGEVMAEAEIIGENISQGMANGLYEKSDAAIEVANWLARRVAAGCSQLLMIHSPSRVFEEFGQYVGEGFALGINESVAAVDHAMGRMMSATTRRPARYRSGSAESTGLDAAPGVAHVTLMVDEDVLGDVVTPLVNDRIGAKINATRR